MTANLYIWYDRWDNSTLPTFTVIGILQVISFLAGLSFFLYNIIQLSRGSTYKLVDKPLIVLGPDNVPAAHPDWHILHHREYRPDSRETRLRQALFSTATNAGLMKNNTRYRVLTPRWSLPEDIDRYRMHILGALKKSIKWDGRTVKQNIDLNARVCSGHQPVEIRESSYVGGLLTNDITEYELVNVGRIFNEIRIDGHKEFLLRDGRTITGMADSALSNSNHIGISTLAILMGNVCVPIVEQSSWNDKSQNLLAPSGSGSMDFEKDISQDAGLFTTILATAMERELKEETAIPQSVKKTTVIGHARLLHRGAKPEYFGVSFVDYHETALRVGWQERIFTHGHRIWYLDCHDFSTLLTRIQKFVEDARHDPEVSIVLRLNLTFLLDYLRADGREARDMLKLN